MPARRRPVPLVVGIVVAALVVSATSPHAPAGHAHHGGGLPLAAVAHR